MKFPDHDSLAYWIPLLVPILMGLVLALAKLLGDLSETRMMMTDHIDAQGSISFMKYVVIDFESFLERVSEGVALSIISIDIWAFTILSDAGQHERSATTVPPYAYPVLGILSHFGLLILVIAIGVAAGGAGIAELTVKLEDPSYFSSSMAVRLLGFCTMLLSVGLGWFVRHGVWLHFERSS